MKSTLTLLLLFASLWATAQQKAKEGYMLPVKGTIRVLVMFAEVDYTNCGGIDPWIDQMGTNSGWAAGSLPTWKGNLFDPSIPLSGPTPGTITDFYHEASFGQYEVVGDYINQIFTIPCTGTYGSSMGADRVYSPLTALNALTTPITSGSGLTLNDFDLTSFTGYGIAKSFTGNDQIDVLIVIWRNNAEGYAYDANQGNYSLNCMAGYGINNFGLQSHQIQPSSILEYKDGIEAMSSFVACTESDARFMIITEYLHGIFGHNNWHTSGGADDWTFLTAPSHFGTTSQDAAQSNVVNAWERLHLNWNNPLKSYTTSATDAATLQEVDLSNFSIQNNPNGGTYILQDFVTTGDAIRIKLPHITGSVKNQYLWLENRQMMSIYDHNKDLSCVDRWIPGLYAYVQAGKDRSEGLTSTEDIFSGSGDPAHPNAFGSWLMPLTAEGNFDFTYRTDMKIVNDHRACLWGNAQVPIDKSTSQENPFTGSSDVFDLYDYNQDGVLRSGDTYGVGLTEIINGVLVANGRTWGDAEDAFTFSGKNKLNIGTNPAPVPVYTYRSVHDYFTGKHEWDPNYLNSSNQPTQIPSFENRIIWLNGLSIEILEEISDPKPGFPNNKKLKVQIRWNNYEIDNDVRWCGDIKLSPNDFDNTLPSLVLNAGKTLHLDHGKSPVQPKSVGTDPVTGQQLFATPSTLRSLANSYAKLKSGSALVIDNKSTYTVEANSILEVDDATIIIRRGGKLLVEDGGLVRVLAGGIIIIEEKGVMEVKGDVGMPYAGKIIVQRGGKLISDGGYFTGNNGGTWDGIEVWGDPSTQQGAPYNNHGIVEIKNGSLIENAYWAVYTGQWNTSVNNGGIARLENSDFMNCRIALNIPPYGSIGGIKNRSYVRECTFDCNAALFNMEGVQNHISIVESYGIKINGCTFRMSGGANFSFSGERGRGIQCINGSFILDKQDDPNSTGYLCDIPDGARRNLFEGLWIGINTHDYLPGQANKNYGIYESDFINCQAGINMNCQGYKKIHRNTMRWDQDLIVDRPSIMPVADVVLGINTVDAENLLIDDNMFEFAQGFTWSKATGISMTNAARTNPSYVYKNIIVNNSGLTSTSTRDIRGNQYTGDNTLLSITCNVYNSLNYDWHTNGNMPPVTGQLELGTNVFSQTDPNTWNLYHTGGAPGFAYRVYADPLSPNPMKNAGALGTREIAGMSCPLTDECVIRCDGLPQPGQSWNPCAAQVQAPIHLPTEAEEEFITPKFASLELWPNPAVNGVNIKVGLGSEEGVLKIIDMKGAIAYKIKVEKEITELNIKTDNWPAGIYLVSLVSSNGERVSQRLVLIK